MSTLTLTQVVHQFADKLTEQYQDARVLEADATLRQLEAALFAAPNKGNECDEEQHGLILEYLRHKALYDTIKQEAEEVRELIPDFNRLESDWEATMEDGRGNKVMWKPSKDSPIHTLRLDGKMPFPAFNVLACLMEVDMYQTWIPTVMGVGMKKLNLLCDLDKYRKLIHVDVAIPWPLANRDCNMVGYGVDLLDLGQVLAVARSYECAAPVPYNVDWSRFPETAHLVNQETENSISSGSSSSMSGPTTASSSAPNPKASKESSKKITSHKKTKSSSSKATEPRPPSSSQTLTGAALRDAIVKNLEAIPTLVRNPKSGVVRARVTKGGFLLTPLGENETQVSFLFQVDPDLAVIPAWLINWGMKHFSFAVLNLLAKAAEKVGMEGDPYTVRMAEKPEVYDHLRKRLQEVQQDSPEQQQFKKNALTELMAPPKPLHPKPEAPQLPHLPM